MGPVDAMLTLVVAGLMIAVALWVLSKVTGG